MASPTPPTAAFAPEGEARASGGTTSPRTHEDGRRVEEWRMPSGRIGKVDLSQPASALEVLRETLQGMGGVLVEHELEQRRDEALTEPVHEDGRPGVGAPDAAETKTTTEQEAGSIVNQTTPDTVEEAIEQGWVDDRALGFTPIMSFGVARGIADAEFARSGRRLLMFERNPGQGPWILYSPELVTAMRDWYAGLPSYLDVLPAQCGATEASAASVAPTYDEAVEGKQACSLFPAWCEGHDDLFPESDGAHMTDLRIGEYSGGEPKNVHVTRYLPTDQFGEPAHWSFSMPETGEWSFGVNEVDRELADGLAELEAARTAIRDFLQVHDARVVAL